MDRSVLWRAAAVQGLSVAVLSVALALALPHSFFEDWGWLAGPGAWIVCALVTAQRRGAPAHACRSSARSSPGCRASLAVVDRRALARRRRGGRAVRAVVCAARPRAGAHGARRVASARMDLGIDGRVALVTGASQGIGRAIAAQLANEGARVAISSRSREKIDATAAEIGATGFVLDSADLDAIPGVLAEVDQALGPVDILICNTGGPPPGARPPRVQPRAVGGRLPVARARADGAHRARDAGHARARLRPDRERREHERARADRDADALQRPPRGDDHLVQDDRAAPSRATT